MSDYMYNQLAMTSISFQIKCQVILTFYWFSLVVSWRRDVKTTSFAIVLLLYKTSRILNLKCL